MPVHPLTPLAVNVYVVVVVGVTVALPLLETVPRLEMLTLVAFGTFQESVALAPRPIRSRSAENCDAVTVGQTAICVCKASGEHTLAPVAVSEYVVVMLGVTEKLPMELNWPVTPAKVTNDA